MFCRFFILRPVLSIVISIIIAIAGLVSLSVSPIEQYPNIVPPCLNITVPFPGANSEAIANAVAAPIEDQMSGIPGMIYMQSSSQNGSNSLTLNVYFDVGTDLRTVEADALNRINTAVPQLPEQVKAQGVTMRMKNPDLFIVAPFYSDTGKPDLVYISNYVQRYIYPLVLQIPGVGVASIIGQRAYSMRVWLDPNKMAYYKIGVADIQRAIQDQNFPYAVGLNAQAPMEGKEKYNFLINSPGYMTDKDQFANIVIRASSDNAQVVKLKDIARVNLEAQQYATYYKAFIRDKKTGLVKSYPATGLALYLMPGANQIDVKNKFGEVLKEAAKHMPNGMKYYYHYDSSEFVILSLESVRDTLIIAFFLVFAVVMLFIQNIKGTIIPVIAIPIAIIGTFAGTYALGFSVNTLTLFGMVLAIGIVVDDAIVVLENIERLMSEEGLNSVDASIKGMEEVASPVIAVVCVLNAVFVPVAFLGGFSGVLMQQFAVTIAISVFISGIVALTLTPTLCSIFLRNVKPHSHEKSSNRFIQMINYGFEKFNEGFEKVLNFYMVIVTFLIDRIKLSMTIWITVFLLVIVLFIKIPTGLIPLEDMGYYYNTVHVNNAGSIMYNLNNAESMAYQIMKYPMVDRIAVLGGLDLVDNSTTKTNSSTMSVILKDYQERHGDNMDVNEAIKLTNNLDKTDKKVTGLAFNQPPIRGMSPTGGVTFYLQTAIPGISIEQIRNDSVKLTEYLEKNYPDVVGSASQFYNVNTPQIYVDVDAKKAYMYKVSYANIFNSLQATFGNYYINYFTMWNDLYWVLLQGDYQYRNRPDLLNLVYVKNTDGVMVPVGTVATLRYKDGPEVVTRLNDYLASQIVVNPNLKKGATSGEVMDVVREALPKVLGKSYALKWFGPAYQEAQAGSKSTIAFSLGIIMVFLILAALYEMWSLPLAIMMALPFALLGAAITLIIFHKPNDIYFQVSMLTLIGLSAKNAILITEFAIDGVRKENMPFREAALHAAKIRFRPIVMTSIAFILGAVPLVTADGAGANSQHSVGLGIIGGMIGSTCIATLFVPVFFVLLMNMSSKKKRK